MYEADEMLIRNPIALNNTIAQFAGGRETYPVDTLTYYPSPISPVVANERYWEYLRRTHQWSPELVRKPREIRVDVRGNFYLCTTRNGPLYEAQLLLLGCEDKRAGEPVSQYDPKTKLVDVLLPQGFGGEHLVYDFQLRPGRYSPASFYTYDEHNSRWSINLGPLENPEDGEMQDN